MSDDLDAGEDVPVKDTPGFYAIIPASVRYDNDLPANAKLLYGEITALCNQKGYCWAGNSYFAKLYNKDERTIRYWINALRDKGHITIDFELIPGTKEIKNRIIKIKNSKNHKNKEEESSDLTADPEKKSSEIKEENLREVGKKFSGGGENNFRGGGKNFPEVGKIISGGGENNFPQNITINNKNNNTTTTTTPDEEKKAAAAKFSVDDIKNALAKLSNKLVFTPDFYPDAVTLLETNDFSLDYLSWIHEECIIKKPREIEGLYYRLFFAGNKVEKYKNIREKHDKPRPDVLCPVCHTSHATTECPTCGLRLHANAEEIDFQKKFYNLPAEKKVEYLKTEAGIFDSNKVMSFPDRMKLLEDLRKNYGLSS